MFIKVYNVGKVHYTVEGFVAVHGKQPSQFITPIECVRLLSWDPSSSQIEVGQWVCCLLEQYHDDLGYISKMNKLNAIMVFVSQFSELRGKWQRGGQPPP